MSVRLGHFAIVMGGLAILRKYEAENTFIDCVDDYLCVRQLSGPVSGEDREALVALEWFHQPGCPGFGECWFCEP